MPEKQRANTHSSRTGTNGKAIKATHNEHNFTAEHVNAELTPNNKVLQFQQVEVDPNYKTKFEQDRYEQAVYEQYFRPYLDSRNAKAEEGRHKERVQTMQQFRQNRKACPEEQQFIIGNVNNPTDPETLWAIYLEYAEWHKQTFPNVMLLNAYLHVDEPNAAPHVQQRQVWTAHEEDMLIINQSKALEEMGIERPFPDKEVSKTNNAKVTYSKMCRAKQIEIARAHGLDIEDNPRQPSENGKTLLQLKMQTMQAENEGLKSENAELKDENAELKDENAELQGQVRELSERVNDLTERAEKLSLSEDKGFMESKTAYQRRQALHTREQLADEREKRLDKREQAVAAKEQQADRKIQVAEYREQHADEIVNKQLQRERQTKVVLLEGQLRQLKQTKIDALNMTVEQALERQKSERKSKHKGDYDDYDIGGGRGR